MAKPKRAPGADWPWWKIGGGSLVSFGTFGMLIGVLPPYSYRGLIVGTVLAFIMTAAVFWSWKTYHWIPQVLIPTLFSIQFLCITLRAWMAFFNGIGLWIFPVLTGYFLAWILPLVNSNLSEFLWREQDTPQTKVGRVVMSVLLAIAPVAGTLGASFGMFSSRFGDWNFAYLFLGSLFSITTVGLAFTFAYQIWRDPPWANHVMEQRAN
jgi:hypothetical protein